MSTIIQKVKLFLEHHHQLLGEGHKQKDIAKQLKIYPSAYSAMVNIVFPKITEIRGSNIDQQVSDVFKLVNNVSERKVRQHIDAYIVLLEDFKSKQTSSASKHLITQRLEYLIQSSPIDILKALEGIYDCFYLSSFGYKVKREPFMIKLNQSKQYLEVRKGNELGAASYSGFLYKTNDHLLTVQLFEDGTLHQDHFLMHLCLPPSYGNSFDFLKGISVSMANSFFPISRKVILKRIGSNINDEDYAAIPTNFFEKEKMNDNIIIEYLYKTGALEYNPIARPDYNETDLKKELDVVTN